jgi:hypothetical protein
MSTTLEQYREAKNNYLKLKNQAKKELIARFNALASEMLQIQRELLEDFGEKVVMPAKPKKPHVRSTQAPAPPAPEPAAAPSAPSPKAKALQKQLERLQKKHAETKAANKPVKAIEDRIYEIEDELRLLQQK